MNVPFVLYVFKVTYGRSIMFVLYVARKHTVKWTE